jgi:phosphoribosylanthranilate isomerase
VPSAVRVKVCGITCVEDAKLCVELGVDALGLNFIADSRRFCAPNTARDIIAATRGNTLVVCVVADATVEEMVAVRDGFGFDCLQLHGDEPPSVLAPLLPHAYKAIRVKNADDVTLADGFGGNHILADARVEGARGGTGKTFEWNLVRGLAAKRSLTLAGGLHAENVADAIRVVRPYCVDVASGVERSDDPRRKDIARVRAFLSAVRAA